MRRLFLLFFFPFLFLSLSLSGCAGSASGAGNSGIGAGNNGNASGAGACSAVFPDGFLVSCEVARTNDEIRTGLMYRTSMEADKGMLFLFQGASTTPFWMKNTKIPLDIMFLDENFTVVSVASAVPCASEPCTLYYPEKPYFYVLEANQGIAGAHQAGKGARLNVSLA